MGPYDERFYRDWAHNDALHRFEIQIKESDLLVLCDIEDKRGAELKLLELRSELEGYIAANEVFKSSLEPLDVEASAPEIVKEMAKAARFWNVGPMAAVAGAVAERVGRHLLEKAQTVIVENGGDIFAFSTDPLRFALYAGEESPFAGKLAFSLDATAGAGVCTSSGVVGPSLSFGRADAVVAIHSNAAFADAAATAIANRIQEPSDVARVVEAERSRGALSGLIACMGDSLGVFGDLRLTKR